MGPAAAEILVLILQHRHLALVHVCLIVIPLAGIVGMSTIALILRTMMAYGAAWRASVWQGVDVAAKEWGVLLSLILVVAPSIMPILPAVPVARITELLVIARRAHYVPLMAHRRLRVAHRVDGVTLGRLVRRHIVAHLRLQFIDKTEDL